MEFIDIAYIKNPETGKTYREENNALQHKYKVGDLVEIIPWEEECIYAGMRLYVIGCVRDCDGTPLYVLGSKGMELYQQAFVKPNTCYNFNSFSGFAEHNLKLIVPAIHDVSESLQGNEVLGDVMVSLIGREVKFNDIKYTVTDYFNYADLIMLDNEITISRIHTDIEWLN